MTSLTFDIEWSNAQDADPRRAGTAAALIILIDDVPATRLLDMWSRTVTDRARLPLYPLAEWFAVNWWRLHAEAPFESGGPPPVEWRLAHDLGAVGSGFVWPGVRFASDGTAIQASARAVRNAPWEPVRYLNDIPTTSIATADFDEAIDGLIRLVIQRLEDLRVDAEPLVSLWADVLAERNDAEVAEWRTWEARLSYDADEAPDHVMQKMAAFAARVGNGAAAELAPLLRPEEAITITKLSELALLSGTEVRITLSDDVEGRHGRTSPWDRGRSLAHSVRRQAGIASGRLDDGALENLLGAQQNSICNATINKDRAAVGLGVRRAHENTDVLHFRKRNLAGRRFEAARFIADYLISSHDDAWLPLTDRATARQKTQRAFAAELLAPIEELTEFVGDGRIPERIEDAGEFYGISPLAIRSHLANHGLLSADEVFV